MLPSDCFFDEEGVPLDMTNQLFFMRATCKSDDIDLNLFGLPSFSKNQVAIIVVLFDLLICVVYFFSCIALKMYQMTTSYEINEALITANDFGVQVKNVPPHTSIRELKAVLWCWAEHVLDREGDDLINPKSQAVDINQNNVMNISFGLTEYGRMEYMMKMSEQLKIKKKYELKMKENPGEKSHWKKKIEDTQFKAKQTLKEMEFYAQNHPSEAVTAFI